MVFRENLVQSIKNIFSHRLRSVITMLIIAFGITALVGILTSTSAIEQTISGQFSRLGATTFTVQNRALNIQIGRRRNPVQVFPPITLIQARKLSAQLGEKDISSSVSYLATGTATLKRNSKKTNPNIAIWAAEGDYLLTAGYELAMGRYFTEQEMHRGSNEVIIGNEVQKLLFSEEENPLGRFIYIGSNRYRVIGVLKLKGASSGFGGDRSAIIPLTNARANYQRTSSTYAVNVLAPTAEALDGLIGEVTAIMRAIKKLKPDQPNNFEIIKSDSFAQILISNLRYVTLAATGIGLITLLGAAIALLNIMLVSVTERTREIGILKALGARKATIRQQFLTEAIVLTQMGGAAGILLGLAIGNLTAYLIGGTFTAPWQWILLAFVLCFVTGVLAGYYPANKAASLDPVEALRYE
ncbi:ABC transporter [Schleiferia thermophila str. Yellowstone]|nr:ABC transporter [Schleiferia thermophila str. Yellowstone]